MRRALVSMLAGVATALVAGWFLVVRLPEWFGPTPISEVAPVAAPEAPVRKIRARLFYVSEDGLRLQTVERDVPFGETAEQQASALVREQLLAPPPPLLSALPAGTSLRALFLTTEGEAYVDLSGEAASGHTGGSITELFSVYAIVNVLTVNLPAITRVQILVEGKEVDSLAGHIDLRSPLPRSDRWMMSPAPSGSDEPTPPRGPAPAVGGGATVPVP